MSFIVTIFFIVRKEKSVLSNYLAVVSFLTAVKITAMFIQVSYIVNSAFLLYYVYYISLFLIAIAGAVFAYENTSSVIKKYIPQPLFYTIMASLTIFFIANTISINLSENVMFSVKLSKYYISYGTDDDLVFFVFIYLILAVTLVFHAISLVKLAKDLSPQCDLKSILHTIFFSKDRYVSYTKKYIASLLFLVFYYVIYSTLFSVFDNSPMISTASMALYLLFYYPLIYMFFQDREERNAFSIRVVIISIISIYSVMFLISMILGIFVINIFTNRVDNDIGKIEYNIQNSISRDQDYLNIDYLVRRDVESGSDVNILYVKEDEGEGNKFIRLESLKHPYFATEYNKYFVTNVFTPASKDMIDDVFLSESLLYAGDLYQFGLSYRRVRQITGDAYAPYFIIYVLLIFAIFLIYAIFVLKPMDRALHLVLEAQKLFIKDNVVISKNYIQTKDEFGYLLESFHNMANNIQYNIKNMTANRDKMQTYSENLEDIIDAKSAELQEAYTKLEQDENVIKLNMAMAMELQRSTLPDFSDVGNLKYNLISVETNQLLVEIFSVTKVHAKRFKFFSLVLSRKEITSSMFSIIMQSEYDNMALKYEKPSEILREINKAFIKNKTGLDLFARAIVIDVDIENSKLAYSSSAFVREYLITDNREVLDLPPTQEEMLGIYSGQVFSDVYFDINGDANLVLLNDEMARNYNNKELHDTMTNLSSGNFDELVDGLKFEIDSRFRDNNVNVFTTLMRIDSETNLDG